MSTAQAIPQHGINGGPQAHLLARCTNTSFCAAAPGGGARACCLVLLLMLLRVLRPNARQACVGSAKQYEEDHFVETQCEGVKVCSACQLAV